MAGEITEQLIIGLGFQKRGSCGVCSGIYTVKFWGHETMLVWRKHRRQFRLVKRNKAITDWENDEQIKTTVESYLHAKAEEPSLGQQV